MRINSTLYYILKDHLGSASVVTDASGNILGEQRYYPFGETRLTTGTIYTDKLFTGQREMTGLGIYHFNARFYSPKLGRFLSADTIVPGAANPQAWNRFSYVVNNPLKYTDPTGHSCIEEDGDGNIIHVDCDSGAPPPPWNPPDDDNSGGGRPEPMPDPSLEPTLGGDDNDSYSYCSQMGSGMNCEIYITQESLSSIDDVFWGAQISTYGLYLGLGYYVGAGGGPLGIFVSELAFGSVALYESSILSSIQEDIYTAANTNTPLQIQTTDSIGLIVGLSGEVGGTWVNTPVAFVTTELLVYLATGVLLPPT